MEKISYTLIPSPMVCCTLIEVELTGTIISNVSFTHGCHGNALALNALIKGMDAGEVIEKLTGVECTDKGTSCADQLALCLRKALRSRERWNDEKR